MQTAFASPKAVARRKTHKVPDSAWPCLADCGDGTYCNPILYADYSDPDAIRVGDDFYLVASSFNCTPGLPILHSRDLVNWTLIAHALKNLPHSRYKKVRHGEGVWAPAIRFHEGKFWIFYPTPDEGIFLVTASQPAGPWSEPHCVKAGKGLIDPCPLWDDDGRAWLVHAYAGSRAGIRHRLRVCPMAPDGSKLLGAGKIVYHQPKKHPTIEGPKFLKRDDWYYILAPAGGVETGWQVALRSKNIYGPYEDKIILAQGRTRINGPHQGALVDTPDDGWWFLHFQDAGPYGRILHLQPVHWEDGWPMAGRHGAPIQRHPKPIVVRSQAPFAPQTSDEFNENKPGLQWQWQANHRDDWYSLAARPGWLRLYPQVALAGLNQQPNLLLQKFPARSFFAETFLELSPLQSGEEAGLVVMGNSYAALGLLRLGSRNCVILQVNSDIKHVYETVAGAIKLRVEVQTGGHCSFSFAENEKWVTLPQTFEAQKGTWVGAKVGLFSTRSLARRPGGHADFDYFRFS
jgi:beta-xylosidase